MDSARAYNISDIDNLSIKCIENPESVDPEFHDAVLEQPMSAEVYNNRGEAKMRIGDCNGARQDFNRALELDSQFAASYINQGLLNLTDYRGKSLEGLFEEGGNIESFSRALLIDNSYIKDYDLLVSSHPNSSKAYAFRGIGRYIVKDLQGSLSDFDRAIKIEPENDLFYQYRSIVKYSLGDKLGAKKDKDRANKLYASQYRLGTKGAVDYGVNFIGSVPINLNPNNVRAYWQKAEGLFAMYGHGMHEYLRVIELQPNNPYAHYRASMILKMNADVMSNEQEKAEKIAEADKYLVKARELMVDNKNIMSLDDFSPNPQNRAEIIAAIKESN